MSKKLWPRRKRSWVLAVVAAAALAACGSDGGDADPQSIDVTAANRDSVAHATAAGVMALSPTGSLPLGAADLGADRSRALGLAGTPPAAWLRKVVAVWTQATRAQAAGRSVERALAVSGPYAEPCALSGSMSITVDDVDNSESLSPGDHFTIAFSSCKDTAFETTDGTVTTTITQVAPTSFSGRMVFQQLAESTANHRLTLNGAALLAFQQTPGSTLESTTMTADGPVTALVDTHLFTDTVTLQNGFVVTATYDPSALPPAGGSEPGQTSSRASGRMHSVVAGGSFDVSTEANQPIAQYDADPYPHAGQVRVQGAKSQLVLTGLSVDAVRLELDADGNGSFESSEVVTWDWLV